MGSHPLQPAVTNMNNCFNDCAGPGPGAESAWSLCSMLLILMAVLILEIISRREHHLGHLRGFDHNDCVGAGLGAESAYKVRSLCSMLLILMAVRSQGFEGALEGRCLIDSTWKVLALNTTSFNLADRPPSGSALLGGTDEWVILGLQLQSTQRDVLFRIVRSLAMEIGLFGNSIGGGDELSLISTFSSSSSFSPLCPLS